MGDLTSGDDSGGSGDSDSAPEMRGGVCDSDGFSTEVSNRAPSHEGGMEPAVVGYRR